MVNILVPTDFSELSRVSIDYAIKVANKLGGNITLLHVVTVIQPTRASMRLRLEALEEEMMQMAKEDMKALITEFAGKNKANKPIAFEIIQGSSFNATVKSVSKKLRSGLIIMGTRGANGLKKVVLGSNTASVIESSNIPVLAVPEFAEFTSFKTVVYATDLKHLDDELELLIPYIKTFESTLHIFHVAPSAREVGTAEIAIKDSIEKTGYSKFQIKVAVSKDIDEAVENYVKETKSDLLTTFAHEHSFYEKLFDRSLTRKLAFQSKVPLLAFREN
ncbi:MAG TPA: universal stress protein [Cyclobacteriaceae bacterium]|nr:universal stress protein [Cyclobacteriaceae bacterium]